MSGSHDFLRQKPFSLFMLAGWSYHIGAVHVCGYAGQGCGVASQRRRRF
jgi:hypothetical protein